MHMADALVSPAVGGAMIALSGAALAYSIVRSRKDDLIDERKVPVMGVMSAFVFAAQMINFTIPGTGSSGHIGGGILLAALLGGSPAFICMTAVLLIQALFFADGGLLAMGCNIWNMGFYTCFLTYPLIFAPIVRKKCTPARLTLASVLAVAVGLQLGAFSVVLQTLLSGVTELPFGAFVTLMQPIHLAIGVVEGLITAAVLVFVWKARPDMIACAGTQQTQDKMSLKKVIAILAICAVVIGGGVSLLASQNPDGLEWSIAGVTGSEELEAAGGVYDAAAAAQESTAILPDYAIAGSDSAAGTSVAGIVGGLIVVAVAGGAAMLIARRKKKGKAA